ncbi:MAG: hypothetical protein JWQ79_2552 [Mucilaginibacter sp.]|jgi:hypothetical protein|nr:hypothetical protein [Mucilaginibacter sp.]
MQNIADQKTIEPDRDLNYKTIATAMKNPFIVHPVCRLALPLPGMVYINYW